MTEVLIIGALLLAFSTLGAIWWAERRPRPLAAFRLRFPANLDSAVPAQFAAHLSGLAHGTTVVFELVGRQNSIEHRLLLPEASADFIIGKLLALVPGLRFVRIDRPIDECPHAIGVRQPRFAALRSDATEQGARALLTALGQVRKGETLVVQWQVGGGFAPPPESLVDEQQESRSELRSARRAKARLPMLQVWGRVGIGADSANRRRQLLSQVLTAYRSLRTTYGDLRFGVMFQRLRAGGLKARRRPWFARSSLFNTVELASVIGWPVAGMDVSGLAVSGAPLLRTPDEVPHRGRVFGRSNYPGVDRQVAQSAHGALSHSLIAGPTGSGKTALLANLIADDLASRRSLVVIDGKGDLATRVLERVPDDRLGGLHVLDLGFGGSQTPVPGLKLFGRADDGELAADLVLGVLADLFADSWGPRSEQWLRVGLVTIASDPEATLADLLYLFWDERYRRSLVSRIKNPLLRASWAQFEAMGASERNHVLAAPLNKLDAVLGRSRMRAVLGQRQPAIDVEQVVNGGGTLIVNLATGAIGSLASRLLGAIVVYEIYRVAAGRSRLPASKRPPAMVVIDEPRALSGLPVPLDVLFEQARGHGVGLTIAAQSISQLPDGVAQAVMSNVATIGAFRQNADDASVLARYLGGLAASDLQGLEAFELMLRLGLGNGRVSTPLTLTTSPLGQPLRRASSVTRAYVERVGQQPADVDRALAERHRFGSGSDLPVGRVRRAEP